ncbi:unnamed protein product [Lactuca saligna]|uniref:Uncharacterized protein n=1 Tax=Lactuca saligna TaxID=75948 RepID=A0AA35Z0P3_LACSI|nr:unnamed protein product [Lactuca saligna]
MAADLPRPTSSSTTTGGVAGIFDSNSYGGAGDGGNHNISSPISNRYGFIRLVLVVLVAHNVAGTTHLAAHGDGSGGQSLQITKSPAAAKLRRCNKNKGGGGLAVVEGQQQQSIQGDGHSFHWRLGCSGLDDSWATPMMAADLPRPTSSSTTTGGVAGIFDSNSYGGTGDGENHYISLPISN